MTSLDEPLALAADASGTAATTRFERFEQWLARASDLLNPILVKEARQALRSRQFSTTFFLMLAAGWTWSILGLALLGPAAYYNAHGPSMFYVYYIILAAPLLIAIPYSAYHSLAQERQDRTYELVSITSLDATRILVGKLSGIGLQMMVYLSALFPCLAFTYLLRGLNIFTVLLVVAYTCLLSLGLAMIGLLLAALSPPRRRPIVQGVVLAALLCVVFLFDISLMSDVVALDTIDSRSFWEVNAVLATLYANAFAVTFLSARALLTTASQNRSTALRVALSVAQLSGFAWFAYGVLQYAGDELVYGLIFGSTMAWFVCGMFIVGESPLLSPRVRRDLPRSPLGRTFLGWLAPGPACGYLFVLSNMVAMAVMALLMSTPQFLALCDPNLPAMAQARLNHPPSLPDVAETGVLAVCYVAIYLGLGKLVLAAVRRYDEVKLSMRVLVHILLLVAGAGTPWVIQLSSSSMRDMGYSLLQASNPIWTLFEYCSQGKPPAVAGNWLITMLPVVAVCVWVFNLPSLAREMRQLRVSKPERVIEDDAQAAVDSAAKDGRTSPWDQ
jgi:hypothetical protein